MIFQYIDTPKVSISTLNTISSFQRLYIATKTTMDTIHGLERSMYVMSTLPDGRCTSYQKMAEIVGGRGGAAGSWREPPRNGRNRGRDRAETSWRSLPENDRNGGREGAALR